MKHYGSQTDTNKQRVSTMINSEESRRLDKAKLWRENHLVWFMLAYFMLPLLALSLLAFSIPYVYTIVPVYQSETCWNSFITEPTSNHLQLTIDYIPCGMKLTNSIMFVVLNWSEVGGFALLFWLVRNIKNELNVKREVQVVLLCWGLFSVIYFSLQIKLQNSVDLVERENLRMGIFLAIQLRNITTLFATTMFSIYMMVRHPERAYPKTIEGKLEALDFDLVLTSPMSFQYFYDFINEQSSYNQPYLELYVLSKLYQEQIDTVMNDMNSPTFQRDCDELER